MYILVHIPHKVQLSKKQRPKYYKEGSKTIPKSYTGFGYTFVDGKLYDTLSETFVVKNKKNVGTPSYAIVNGQELYNQGMSKFVRLKVVEKLHAFFKKIITDKVFEGPVELDFVRFGDINDDHIQDNSQLWLVCKVFEDVLHTSGVIEDDHPRISRKSSIKFIHNPEFSNLLLIRVYDYCRTH